jgi:hypothetical protein
MPGATSQPPHVHIECTARILSYPQIMDQQNSQPTGRSPSAAETGNETSDPAIHIFAEAWFREGDEMSNEVTKDNALQPCQRASVTPANS